MAKMSDAEDEEFKRKLAAWIRDTVGIPDKLLEALQNTDDDWTFIIKIHGIIEAALNHMILGRLMQPPLADIVSHLETNDRRTGKIAFVKALDLLPEHGRTFVRVISEVRNRLVHDIKNFEFDLKKYLINLDNNQIERWKVALTWGFSDPVPGHIFEFSVIAPRFSIYSACQSLLFRCYMTQPERMLEAYQMVLNREARKRAESSATEQ